MTLRNPNRGHEIIAFELGGIRFAGLSPFNDEKLGQDSPEFRQAGHGRRRECARCSGGGLVPSIAWLPGQNASPSTEAQRERLAVLARSRGSSISSGGVMTRALSPRSARLRRGLLSQDEGAQ